jgi:hypothetical protein
VNSEVAVKECGPEQMKRLAELLGDPERSYICEESVFCEEYGCPIDQLESWLQKSWIEHDMLAILEYREAPPVHSVLLVKRHNDFCTMRLLSFRELQLPVM